MYSIEGPAPRLVKIFQTVIIILLALIGSSGTGMAGGGTEEFTIPGGPAVLLQEYPESPVVCVTVAIEAGSAWETPDTRGLTHLLEHLCFDGSERYTREEISGWVDRTGAFLNAFTRKETTVYFLLVDRSRLEEALDILSQMLLHSVFPIHELEKERKVVLEEMRQSMDNPGEERSRLVDRFLYRGSGLTEPVLGYPTTIEAISRQQIIDYYRSNYSPDRMKIFVMGGYDRRQLVGWLGDYFMPTYGEPGRTGGSRVMAGSSAKRRKREEKSTSSGAMTPRWSSEVTRLSDPRFAGGIEILVPLPGIEDRDFGAVLLLEELLSSADTPLSEMLESASWPEAQVYLEVHREFSAIRFSMETDGETDKLLAVPGMIEKLASWKPSGEEVEAARMSLLARDALNREKYHFYIMLSGERLAFSAGRYMEASTKGVREADADDVARVISSSFDPLCYNAVLMGSPPESSAIGGDPPSRVKLHNGCELAAYARSGSDIAAVHILVKGRSCLETDILPGMTVILNAILENSSGGKALSDRLRALGVSISYSDNPYIPMDNYYLNNAWSFMRIEGPAENIIEGVDLVVTHIRGAVMGETEIAGLARSLVPELGIRSSSSSGRLRGLMMERLFGGHPFAGSIFPSPGSLGMISPETLAGFRAKSICGSNLIVTIVSPLVPEEALKGLEKIFFGLPSGSSSICPAITDTVVAGLFEKETDRRGALIGAGWRLLDPSPMEAAALIVASEVLSRRMQLQIREVEGLAYSTGCSALPYPGAAISIAYVNTGGENLETASTSLEREIRGLLSAPPDEDETALARRRLIARLTRREMSSINKAFAMGLDILLREGSTAQTLLGGVTSIDVQRTVAEVMEMENAVFVRLKPAPGAPEKKSMPMRMMR
ncbi:MAG: insulinase family protein [Bacteroidales bacterium]|nr:insulinase family protein [Candidatus Latescibacterota bacterium]